MIQRRLRHALRSFIMNHPKTQASRIGSVSNKYDPSQEVGFVRMY